MEKKTYLIIGLIIIIIILFGIIVYPKAEASIKGRYQLEGYQLCVIDVISTIINDLQTKGYTEIRLGNQTLILIPAIRDNNET